jgi:hypothetical protein
MCGSADLQGVGGRAVGNGVAFVPLWDVITWLVAAQFDFR